jgi:hypothetical protein
MALIIFEKQLLSNPVVEHDFIAPNTALDPLKTEGLFLPFQN